MSPIEVRRGKDIICTCKDETCLYEDWKMKDMKANGYKFYQGGKIYKTEKKTTAQN